MYKRIFNKLLIGFVIIFVLFITFTASTNSFAQTLSEEKVQEILTFSNATAALTVCKKGAIGALPLKEEVLAKISER